MLEARMTKCAVQPENGNTVLMAKFERFGDEIGVRVAFDWTILDRRIFLEDLRNSVAREFDIPTYHVDIDENHLFKRMETWTQRLRKLRLVYTAEDLN